MICLLRLLGKSSGFAPGTAAFSSIFRQNLVAAALEQLEPSGETSWSLRSQLTEKFRRGLIGCAGERTCEGRGSALKIYISTEL